ncbi:MAG: hypothetical protein LBG21_06870 [Campylobacteraceae bacterium]|jgi:hypothetical protein|nr:hypothetical protein [Campylobacteraceae bacterium]
MAIEDFSIEYIVENYNIGDIEHRIAELENEDATLPFPIRAAAIERLKSALDKSVFEENKMKFQKEEQKTLADRLKEFKQKQKQNRKIHKSINR